MSELAKLAQHRDAILLAELAGLLHNIGKLNPNFLKSTVEDERNAVQLLKENSQFVDGYAFKRFAKPAEEILDASVRTLLASNDKLNLNELPKSSNPEKAKDVEHSEGKAAETFNKFYRGTGPLSSNQAKALSRIIRVASESWRLTDLLTLFWDEFFYKPDKNDYQRIYALDRWLKSKPNHLPKLLIHAHGEMSGSEKYQVVTKEDGSVSSESVMQKKSNFDSLRIATAFGYETEIAIWEFHHKQQAIINQAATLSLDNENWRLEIQAILGQGLGDTQRPINEITLWDYASSIAALFKTSIAKSFLEGHVADANQMYWRLLGVRFDGLDYILQASRIADLLGRQQKFKKTLNSICTYISQDIPIASQVYQDEQGSFFVVPDSDILKLKDIQSLIKNRLESIQFDDLRPSINWSENCLRGKQLNLGQELKCQDDMARPSIDPLKLSEEWKDSSTQICEVCGLRPALSRKITYCTSCKNNRQSRVKIWQNDLRTTIWLDEVADSNGRLALITGKFPLNGWLEGTLVETLALGMAQDGDKETNILVPKFASFPRVQRIWQTTQTFWKESQANIATSLTDYRNRLAIELANQPTLRPNQTYNLDLDGRTRMSVLWNGEHLVSIDNLTYTAIQLGIDPKERTTPVDAAIAVGVWLEDNRQNIFQLISDDEKNTQHDVRIKRLDHQDTHYAMTIPILAEPRTFMSLVPADRALDMVQAIKTKYEREMGKVRNRLPLHVGVVYAGRRTPLRAILDAGRRMLNYEAEGANHEQWTVQTDAEQGRLPYEQEALAEGTQQFDETVVIDLEQNGRSLTWYVPAVMGDGVTPDDWYPYLFIDNDVTDRDFTFKAMCPTKDNQMEERNLIHARQLKAGDEVYFTPATFDFQWLDRAGRRFEIAYDDNGRRRGHLGRPYLLDELATIQAAWQLVSDKTGLANSQIYALRDLVESKRESWQPTPEQCQPKGMFWKFCHNAIVNANWKQVPTKTQLEQLTNWAVSGLFMDVIQLYMGIMKL